MVLRCRRMRWAISMASRGSSSSASAWRIRSYRSRPRWPAGTRNKSRSWSSRRRAALSGRLSERSSPSRMAANPESLPVASRAICLRRACQSLPREASMSWLCRVASPLRAASSSAMACSRRAAAPRASRSRSAIRASYSRRAFSCCARVSSSSRTSSLCSMLARSRSASTRASTDSSMACRRAAFSRSSSSTLCVRTCSTGGCSREAGRTSDAVRSSSPNSATRASHTCCVRGYTQQRRSGSQR